MKKWADTFLGILCRYFRIEISGLEHIPSSGPAVIIANHSGWMGLDALLLAYLVRTRAGRVNRTMAHRGYFDWSKRIQKIAFINGLRRPKKEDAFETLRGGDLLILFPEGESGNFKSSAKRYQLQHFHKGFVHIAADAKVPVIPCAIVGAEEAQLNLGSIHFGSRSHPLRIPLPVPLPPLPSQWKIQFLPPILPENLVGFGTTPYSRAAGVAESIRYELQEKVQALRHGEDSVAHHFSEPINLAHRKSTMASSSAGTLPRTSSESLRWPNESQ